jgi:signal transduction histidine kinase
MSSLIKESDMLTMSELNRRILRLGQQGLARQVFLARVSEELLQFTDCDALELRLADEMLQYLWHYSAAGGGFFYESEFMTQPDGSLVPCLESENFQEAVCSELFKIRYNAELNYYYSRQSILISDTYHDKHYSNGEGNTLGDETGYGSMIFISFITDDDIPGLLIIKKERCGFINPEDKLLFESLAQTLGIAIAFRRSQYALGERLKELSCLHSISKLLQESDLNMDETFEKLVSIIPESFQYPDETACNLKIREINYKTASYRESSRNLCTTIISDREIVGELTICLLDSHLDFLPEEHDLCESICLATGALYRKLLSEKERKETEEKLRQADRLATIGQLAAGIAHELNEPLSNILGYAQLASESACDKQLVEDLQKIINSSLHAREIVRKLLLFSRQMPMHKKQLNLNDIIDESLEIVGNRLNKHNIELRLVLEENLPDLTADSSQLKQVVINLLVNAEQAMPSGGRLMISTIHKEGKIELEVKDSGTGMSESVQKKIFLPFFTTKSQGEGTGLGLAVVHGIVKTHGGTIKVKSGLDQGTSIRIILPITEKY